LGLDHKRSEGCAWPREAPDVTGIVAVPEFAHLEHDLGIEIGKFALFAQRSSTTASGR
jgi:hypothetical protein